MSELLPEPSVASVLVFELSDSDRMVLGELEILDNPIKYRALNALRHLNRGWKLKDVDKEMALFRAITAEEEIATAIILSMKRHRYPGADLLHKNNHNHKRALIPLVYTTRHAFAAAMPNRLTYRVYFEAVNGKRCPRIEFVMQKLQDGREIIGTPDMPLNFSFELQKLTGESREPASLIDYMRDLFNPNNQRKIITLIKERANLRNRLLYASDEGYPTITADITDELIKHKNEVFILLWLLCMIDTYPAHQLLVSQSVTELLKILEIEMKLTSAD